MKKIFHQSIKPRAVEELVDYYVFRRMAAWFVPLLARLKLTPNQVSFLCLLSGFATAWVFFRGHFFVGSLFLWATVVLDCCDGMLARYTGQSSPVGRMIDGTFDSFWGTAIWLGILFSGRLDEWGRGDVFRLMLAASISMYAHCWTFESVKNAYLLLCNPEFSESDIDSRQAWQLMKQSLSNGKYFEAFIYVIMTGYQHVFAPKKEKREALIQNLPPLNEIRRQLDLPVRLWTFAGEGTHNAAIIFFGLLTPLYPGSLLGAFWVILVPINLVWGVAIFIWFLRKKRVLRPPDLPACRFPSNDYSPPASLK